MDQSSQAGNARDLEEVIHTIHDKWFNVEAIEFVEEVATLVVPFHEKSGCEGSHDGALLIRSVKAYQIEETEGVGCYDFDEVRFAPERGVLTITTGIPLTFHVTVTSLAVEVSK